MKLIFPILICSAISAALGYYFGHITIPVTSGQVAATTTMPQAAPAPTQPQYVEPQPMADFEPIAEPEPIDEPEPIEELATAPDQTTSSYAERAALTTHTLTDTQGREIQATIIEVTENTVKIRRTSDRLETKIPLNMLSAEDAAFCNYLREQAAKKEATKPATSDEFNWDAYFNS
jgi:hypothetical protein